MICMLLFDLPECGAWSRAVLPAAFRAYVFVCAEYMPQRKRSRSQDLQQDGQVRTDLKRQKTEETAGWVSEAS